MIARCNPMSLIDSRYYRFPLWGARLREVFWGIQIFIHGLEPPLDVITNVRPQIPKQSPIKNSENEQGEVENGMVQAGLLYIGLGKWLPCV